MSSNNKQEGKVISKIFVQDIGWIYANESGLLDDYTPIEVFMVNGEMAEVAWYRQGNKEFNGKYVIVIEYN